MPMKVREILKLIKDDGWFEVEQEGSHRQFKHPTKKGESYGARSRRQPRPWPKLENQS